jgi:hypothetical protein
MCAVPALLLLAGRGWATTVQRRPVLGWALAVLAVAVSLPQLVAYSRDGNRHDLRGVAQFLAENALPEDIIVADEHAALDVYLHGQPGFADTVTIEESLIDARKRHDFLRNRAEIWVAVKLSRLGSTYDDTFTQWLEESFTEISQVGARPPPLVRHDNRYMIFRRTSRVRPGMSSTRGPGHR